jgi:DNA-binding LytR/AlgR family response regulator
VKGSAARDGGDGGDSGDSAGRSSAAAAPPRALIAEDEPLLAGNLAAELARLWPELDVVANVRDGAGALEAAIALAPDVLFLDVRMPGMSGIEVAQAIVEDWEDGLPPPLLVFVTAYDEYAVEAFEQAAVDYVLKPVTGDRLERCCRRLRAVLAGRRDAGNAAERIAGDRAGPAAAAMDSTLLQLRRLLEERGAPSGVRDLLTVIQASVGNTLHFVPIAEVLYFAAADKYIQVVTAAREYVIRLSLRQLVAQLDPQEFWQVHRGSVVRVSAIATAVRDDGGKIRLKLRDRAETLPVSRLYAHLFKPM